MIRYLLLLILLFALAACTANDGSDMPTVTAPVTATTTPVAPTLTPSTTPAAGATTTATATPAPAADEPRTFRVVYVAPDDLLNVRIAAGPESAERGGLPPGTDNILVTGSGIQVEGSLWLPISHDGASGWVNSAYLTEQIASFCDDPAAVAVLQTVETAIADEDGALLASIVHPDRGLRLRTAWWNPEVKLAHPEVETIFESDDAYDWGVEMGSGDPLNGSFRETVLPDLRDDLLPATEQACNEILSGSTAGLVQLPPEYEGINYYSLYRPAAEGTIEFDWGTWVAGVERWGDNYYLAFLVHYYYEI